MIDKDELIEGGICAWIDAYLRGEISADTFAEIVIFNHLRTQDGISDKLKAAITIVMSSLVSKEPFLPQDRKKEKEQLKKIMDTFNRSDKKDKTKEIEPLIEEFLDIIVNEPNNVTQG